MKKLILFFASLILIISFTGCSVDKSASTLGDNYYKAMQNKDYDMALTYFSSDFYDNISQSDWQQILQNIDTKLGNLESYKLIGWDKSVMSGINVRNGTTYILNYEVIYSNETVDEYLTMFQPKNDQLQIEKWQSSSTLLLK